MSTREYMVYEWQCDGCGDTEADEVEGIPLDWETLDDGDYCERCAAADVSTPPASTGGEDRG